jgi:Uma2 family endonuclease
MVEPARERYRFDEYLRLEEESPVKHEFLEGHVWAMAGGTIEHAALCASATTIVEVLSPSTEAYDRGEKLEHYRRIPSLEEIVLVAHDTRRVEVWRRSDEGWSREEYAGDATAELRSNQWVLSLGELYRDPLGGR